MIVNADGSVVGRLATVVAKKLLNGEGVIVVNAEKAIISGNPKDIVAKYTARRAVKVKSNPEHSPKWPKRPDMLLRRIIRGMLPFDKPRGKAAFKKLKTYIGVSEEFKGKEFEVIGKKEVRGKTLSLLELCKELGYHG